MPTFPDKKIEPRLAALPETVNWQAQATARDKSINEKDKRLEMGDVKVCEMNFGIDVKNSKIMGQVKSEMWLFCGL